jgi:uncharacterized membrane protein
VRDRTPISTIARAVPKGAVVPIAAYNSDAYNVVLILHILTVIIGLGAVFLNAIYGAQAKARRGPEGLAIAQANLKVTEIAQYFIYGIPIFGIALVFMSKTDGIQFYDWDQTWIWLSIVLYLVALGLSHGVLMPAVKRMQVLMGEVIAAGPPAGGPPPQAAEMEQLGKRIAPVGATLNLLVIVIVALMVFKPGGP